MLFHVKMEAKLPLDMEPEAKADLIAREKAYGQKWQREGSWVHLWRVAGITGNMSIFDVPDIETLHDILTGLPFFPYITFEITPLCQHPSRVEPDSAA